MRHVREQLGVSERRACHVLHQPRSTQRRVCVIGEDGSMLTKAIIALATEYGRYGYRRVTALLNQQGWHINHCSKLAKINICGVTSTVRFPIHLVFFSNAIHFLLNVDRNLY
ncbi:MAG: transposase [Proteobacteria bacterium]|nr:transposase [Pseudomonadota bacterium]